MDAAGGAGGMTVNFPVITPGTPISSHRSVRRKAHRPLGQKIDLRYPQAIQDGAKYHTSAETKAFFAQQAARLQVFQLPTYSPDYNPIEKLWKKIKQQDTHLHYFPTFEALTNKVEQALLKFANIPEEILALCSLPTELAQAA
jgi:transposase